MIDYIHRYLHKITIDIINYTENLIFCKQILSISMYFTFVDSFFPMTFCLCCFFCLLSMLKSMKEAGIPGDLVYFVSNAYSDMFLI